MMSTLGCQIVDLLGVFTVDLHCPKKKHTDSSTDLIDSHGTRGSNARTRRKAITPAGAHLKW